MSKLQALEVLSNTNANNAGSQFTETKSGGVSSILRNLGVILYAHHGVSMMDIAKLFKVSTVAVLKWIRRAYDSALFHLTPPLQRPKLFK